MSIKITHPFHLVDYRPWPFTRAIRTITLIIGLIKWFHQLNFSLVLIATLVSILSIFQWWRDISREGTFQGLHSIKVTDGLKLGIILFIVSEVFFFISFFWRFFHNSLSPNVEIGINWPPVGIKPFNLFQVPLLNTIILLSSGISVTWSHHRILKNNYSQTNQRLTLTILLGIYFTLLQYLEYKEATFSISDSIYGSTFFIATGFHGIHVLVGTTFLLISLIRNLNFHFSINHHFGFEAAAWYWHFVDVVWLFLYISIYWWGS